MRIFRWFALALFSCSNGGGEPPTAQSSAALVTHTFDLASNMPPHLAIMFSMSWFGIPKGDPQGAGPDSSYANSKFNASCADAGTVVSDPSQCSTCVVRGSKNVCLTQGAAQRDTASRRRLLAGPYSASAIDAEGAARVDLMLSNVRRSCDDGARIDAWSVQLNGTHDTPAHPTNPQSTAAVIEYEALGAFFKHADDAGMSVIVPGDDTTIYLRGQTNLGACDDSKNNPRQNCIDALTTDYVDMVTLALAHPSSLKINGNPVILAYIDPGQYTPTEWTTILQNARNTAAHDFYAVAMVQGGGGAPYFAAFDALAPWIQIDWANTTGTSTRDHAKNWSASHHDPLVAAAAKLPGRVVFGGATPGFDDFTMNWGGCNERQLPPGSDARDPALLDGEFDYFASQKFKGLTMETWDDWTEGSEFEPDVAGGPAVLLQLRQNLGTLYGDAPDANGDQRLADRWNKYGEARNCAGGSAGTPPKTPLVCPASDAGASDAGSGADASSDAAIADGSIPADGGTGTTTSNCGCTFAGDHAPRGAAALVVLAGALARRRRKPRRS